MDSLSSSSVLVMPPDRSYSSSSPSPMVVADSPSSPSQTRAATDIDSAVSIPDTAPSEATDVQIDDDTKMDTDGNDSSSNDATVISSSAETPSSTVDQNTRGALDALAALASTLSSSRPNDTTTAQNKNKFVTTISPHQTSSDDDSEVMPPPPPRSPSGMNALSTMSTSESSSSLFSSGFPQSTIKSGSGTFDTFHNMRTGRLRSASNPEGMEKWDSYSKRHDRQHFVLPFSILEEELASTRRVLGETVEEEYSFSSEAAFSGTGAGGSVGGVTHGFTYNNTTNDFHGQSSSSGMFSGDSALHTLSTIRIASTSNDVASKPNSNLPRKKRGNNKKTINSDNDRNQDSENTNATPNSNKKSQRKQKSKAGSNTTPPRASPERSNSPNGSTKSNESGNGSNVEEEEVDESLLDPEELLRRARSRLLEDLSEGAGVGGEKGVLTLPHSLSKYKEVYNKNGRIGIYTPAERAAIITKFNAKRARRVWNKKIRYNCRKNLADRRMRVKGRFVKRSAEAVATTTEPPSEEYASSSPPMQTTGSIKTVGLVPNEDAMEDEVKDNKSNGGMKSSRPNTPPTSGSPLPPVDENEVQDSYHDDEEMPDVDDDEAGFEPSDDMPYRRTRRYTIT